MFRPKASYKRLWYFLYSCRIIFKASADLWKVYWWSVLRGQVDFYRNPWKFRQKKDLNWKGIQCFTWLCPFIKIWNLEIDLEYSKSIFDYSRKICTVFLGHVKYLVISFLKRTLLSKIIWLMTIFRISKKSFISMEKIYGMYHFHI